MDLAMRNLSVIIFLSVVGALLLILLIFMLYLNRAACFKRCDGKTCFDVKKIMQKAEDWFTDSSSDEEEETTPIADKEKKSKGADKPEEPAKETAQGAKEAENKELK